MRDPDYKVAWEVRNVVLVAVKINRTQNPELYAEFADLETSKGAKARELMQAGLNRHAVWIKTDGENEWKCEHCGGWCGDGYAVTEPMPYCPYCGFKMEEK